MNHKIVGMIDKIGAALVIQLGVTARNVSYSGLKLQNNVPLGKR
ncbi:MAG: hypothetical protein AB8U25_02940 [Rickettsiales endosymbiont of Dermacentor nuttalli]